MIRLGVMVCLLGLTEFAMPCKNTSQAQMLTLSKKRKEKKNLNDSAELQDTKCVRFFFQFSSDYVFKKNPKKAVEIAYAWLTHCLRIPPISTRGLLLSSRHLSFGSLITQKCWAQLKPLFGKQMWKTGKMVCWWITVWSGSKKRLFHVSSRKMGIQYVDIH